MSSHAINKCITHHMDSPFPSPHGTTPLPLLLPLPLPPWNRRFVAVSGFHKHVINGSVAVFRFDNEFGLDAATVS